MDLYSGKLKLKFRRRCYYVRAEYPIMDSGPWDSLER